MDSVSDAAQMHRCLLCSQFFGTFDAFSQHKCPSLKQEDCSDSFDGAASACVKMEPNPDIKIKDEETEDVIRGYSLAEVEAMVKEEPIDDENFKVKQEPADESTDTTEGKACTAETSKVVVCPISHEFKCQFCGKEFSRRVYFIRHSTGVCKYCDEKFHCKTQLMKHNCGQHRRPRECQFCPICNKDFSSKYSLKAHIKRVHNKATEKEVSCQVCRVKFRTRQP
jgi:hypothetical protein